MSTNKKPAIIVNGKPIRRARREKRTTPDTVIVTTRIARDTAEILQEACNNTGISMSTLVKIQLELFALTTMANSMDEIHKEFKEAKKNNPELYLEEKELEVYKNISPEDEELSPDELAVIEFSKRQKDNFISLVSKFDELGLLPSSDAPEIHKFLQTIKSKPLALPPNSKA